MNEFTERLVNTLGFLSELKKYKMLNPMTANLLLSAHLNPNPARELKQIQTILKLSEMFKGPFNLPDESVNGLIKFALTEKGIPAGFNPEECHFLIVGQTGCGKSTLLKTIFAQALLFNEE